jgi:hypothetical protein
MVRLVRTNLAIPAERVDARLSLDFERSNSFIGAGQCISQGLTRVGWRPREGGSTSKQKRRRNIPPALSSIRIALARDQ